MQVNGQVVNGGGSSSSAGVGGLKRGTKRDASDSNLDQYGGDSDRFLKRLHLLNLRGAEQNGASQSNLYTTVSNAPAASTPNGISHANHISSDNESMQVDDTRDRIYIHDLDKELEDVESNDGKERLIFLPDIEKHFSKLPQHLLTGDHNTSRELVLSSVPKSLTIDEGHDSVRKAIIESRQRAREKAVEEARHAEAARNYDHSGYVGSMLDMEPAEGYHSAYAEEQHDHDPDAMDLG